jgi:hypothetical protein
MGTTQKQLMSHQLKMKELDKKNKEFWQLLTSGKIGTNVGSVKVITEDNQD